MSNRVIVNLCGRNQFCVQAEGTSTVLRVLTGATVVRVSLEVCPVTGGKAR